jgi:hypothetical protein
MERSGSCTSTSCILGSVDIEREPDLAGVTTHPDFLLRRDGKAFIEATVAGMPDPVTASYSGGAP